MRVNLKAREESNERDTDPRKYQRHNKNRKEKEREVQRQSALTYWYWMRTHASPDRELLLHRL